MEIKVNTVRYKKISLEKNVIPKKIDLLVVKGKLILIPDRNGEYINRLNGDFPDYICYRGFCKPIIISEVEEIQIDDWVYNEDILEINDCAKITNEDGLKLARKINAKKILAFSNDFSKKQIEKIIDGRLKHGDKLWVECCRLTHDNETLVSHNGFKLQVPINIQYIIISNPHINFYSIKKKFTYLEMKNIALNFGLWIVNKDTSNSSIEDIDRWFKENVK